MNRFLRNLIFSILLSTNCAIYASNSKNELANQHLTNSAVNSKVLISNPLPILSNDDYKDRLRKIFVMHVPTPVNRNTIDKICDKNNHIYEDDYASVFVEFHENDPDNPFAINILVQLMTRPLIYGSQEDYLKTYELHKRKITVASLCLDLILNDNEIGAIFKNNNMVRTHVDYRKACDRFAYLTELLSNYITNKKNRIYEMIDGKLCALPILCISDWANHPYANSIFDIKTLVKFALYPVYISKNANNKKYTSDAYYEGDYPKQFKIVDYLLHEMINCKIEINAALSYLSHIM